MIPRTYVLLACFVGLVLVAFFCAPGAGAQSLPLGSVSNPQPISCVTLQNPTMVGPANFFRDFDPSMTNCYTATLICPTVTGIGLLADPLPFVYGIAPAHGATVRGTIVMFTGDGGEVAGNLGFQRYYVPYYESLGYQVVEVAWGAYGTKGTAWELANSSGGAAPNVLNAACRPATFLHFVKTNIWTVGGMCVHGDSGGSAAAAYALTWFGRGADVDKVLFENGPVYSDINRGCEVNFQNGTCSNGQMTYICAPGQGGSGPQYGCSSTWAPLGQGAIDYSLEYVGGDANSVNLWTGNTGPNSPSCGNQFTTQGACQTTYNWTNMSLVVGSAYGAAATFTYSQTGMSAWLCETVNSGAYNNSMSQGEVYYLEFTMASQADFSLSVNGITGCPTTEDVEEGAFGTAFPEGTAYMALEQDMVGTPQNPLLPSACVNFRRD